jgi:hypothetical protein
MDDKCLAFFSKAILDSVKRIIAHAPFSLFGFGHSSGAGGKKSDPHRILSVADCGLPFATCTPQKRGISVVVVYTRVVARGNDLNPRIPGSVIESLLAAGLLAHFRHDGKTWPGVTPAALGARL